jgi:hypothetical protein
LSKLQQPTTILFGQEGTIRVLNELKGKATKAQMMAYMAANYPGSMTYDMLNASVKNLRAWKQVTEDKDGSVRLLWVPVTGLKDATKAAGDYRPPSDVQAKSKGGHTRMMTLAAKTQGGNCWHCRKPIENANDIVSRRAHICRYYHRACARRVNII